MEGSPRSLTKKRVGWRKFIQPYILLTPAFGLMALLVIYPFFTAVQTSLHHFILTRPHSVSFVGLENFRTAAQDPIVAEAVHNTMVWVLSVVGTQVILGTAIALVLNENFFLRGIVRSIVLIPWVTPSVVAAIMFMWLFDGTRGAVNTVLQTLGIIDKPVLWLSVPGLSLLTAVVALVWHGVPFFAIMILAALQTIPEDLYEAAKVDGSNALTSFRYVTLPLIMPTLAIMTLLRTIWVSNHIDIPYVMTHGGPGCSALTLPMYAILVARVDLDFGYATALSMVMGGFVAVGAAVYLIYMRGTEELQ